MKIICADRVSNELSYDTNFKWHMPIWGEICRAEKNICHFLGPSSSAISGKNPQHIYKLIQCYALDFFPQIMLGDGPTFWNFFQDSRIRVKTARTFSGNDPKQNIVSSWSWIFFSEMTLAEGQKLGHISCFQSLYWQYNIIYSIRECP